MIIRKAKIDDVNDIVSIHCSAFKGFFLTSLGPQFLKLYYSCFIKSNETITMIAENDEKILGFSSSAKVCKGFNRRLIKSNVFDFGLLSFKMLFTNPMALYRLVKNLTKIGDSVEDNAEYAELYSIGVINDAQGMGIGKKLLAESEQVMKKDGVERVSLTTDYYNNEQAIGFYHAVGYEVLYEFTAYPDRKMYRLIKIL